MADTMSDSDGKGATTSPAGKGVGSDPKEPQPGPADGPEKGKGVGSEPAGSTGS